MGYSFPLVCISFRSHNALLIHLLSLEEIADTILTEALLQIYLIDVSEMIGVRLVCIKWTGEAVDLARNSVTVVARRGVVRGEHLHEHRGRGNLLR